MAEKIKTIASISYCNFEIPNINLEDNLSSFKTQFINEFSLEDQITPDDKIALYYEQKNKRMEVNSDEDFQEMLEYFFQKNEKPVVYVETEKIPVSFSSGKSIEFEDEIKNVVKRELCIAANKIKKCLTTNISLSNSKKVRTQTCDTCKQQIIGYLYKKISPDKKDCYYCELCSTKQETPMFKIH